MILIPNIPFLIEFLGYIDYLSSYLPKLEHAHLVSASTRDPKISVLNPTDVLTWAFRPNLITKLSETFDQIR